jgi:putative membrane protein
MAWTTRARAVFGTTAQEAEATLEMAFNQGFYNLFLAITVGLGIVLHAAGQHAVAATLVLTGAGSMMAASLVLLLSSPDKAGAAIKQGALPAVGVALLVVGLL